MSALDAFDAADQAAPAGGGLNTLDAFDKAEAVVSQPAQKPKFSMLKAAGVPQKQDFGEGLVRGAAGSIYGGLKGIATLVSGGSLQDAVDAIHAGQEATASDAPMTMGARIGNKVMASPYNPLNYPAEIGGYVGGKLSDAGHPGLAVTADVGAQLLGGPMVLKTAGKGLRLVRPAQIAGEGARPLPSTEQITQTAEPVIIQEHVIPEQRIPINDQLDQWGVAEDSVAATPPSPAANAAKKLPIMPGPMRKAVPITEQDNPWIRQPEARAQQRPIIPSANEGHTPTLDEAPADLKAAAAKVSSPDPVVLGRHVEAETLPVPIRLSEGQATGDPHVISHEMNNRDTNGMAERLNEQNAALVSNLKAVKTNAAPNVPEDANHLTYGQGLIDEYKAHDEALQQDINAKYQALKDEAGGTFPIDGPIFVKNAKASLDAEMKDAYVPAPIQKSLDKFSDPKYQMTFKDFENMRTNLAAEARKAERSGDGNAAAAVRLIRQQLEELPLTGEAEGLKPLADAARSAARARFQAIESDPAYKAAINDGVERGELSPRADKFIQQYVIAAPAANVARIKQTLPGNANVDQLISGGALHHMERQSVRSGKFTQAGFNGVLAKDLPPQKQAVIFDPKTRQQVNAIGNVAGYVQRTPSGAYVNSSNTAIAAKQAGTSLLNLATGGLAGKAAEAASPIMRDIRAAKLKKPAAGLTPLKDIGKK